MKGLFVCAPVLVAIFALTLNSHEALAERNETVAVIYPATEGSYRTVFQGLLDGIEGRLGTNKMLTYRLAAEQDDSTGLKTWLAEKKPKAVITLGRQAFESYQTSGLRYKAISGGLDLSRDLNPKASGVSLSVAPDLFFKTLKRLIPGIRRVFVVYNPTKDRWLVEFAKEAAFRARPRSSRP